MSEKAALVPALEELAAAISGYEDPRGASDEWKRVYRLLQKTDVRAGRVQRVVGMRDLAGLGELIQELRAPQAPTESQGEGQRPDAATCRRALKAFRKRLKVTCLDEESKLGYSPLTKGEDGRAARMIRPPAEWPAEVWAELVRQGRLRYLSHGLYELGTE